MILILCKELLPPQQQQEGSGYQRPPPLILSFLQLGILSLHQ